MSLFPNGDPAEEARLLLPWYITGKLTEPERRLVEQMLAQNPELKSDYQRELRMVGLIRENTSLLQLTTVDSTPQRLDKLMKRIEREESAKAAPAARPTTTAKPKAALGWWQRLRNLLPDSGWLTPANAVFATLLVMQVGVLGWFAHLVTAPTEDLYVSASVADKQTAVPVTDGMKLLVEFKDNAQVQELRSFLLKWNAHITDGPDANNLFKIEIRDTPATDKRSAVILQQMQQDQAVVTFIGQEF
jgi:hypothetical protein